MTGASVSDAGNLQSTVLARPDARSPHALAHAARFGLPGHVRAIVRLSRGLLVQLVWQEVV